MLAVFFGLGLLHGSGVQAVEIDWVAVGAPGNEAGRYGFGAVAYPYQVSKYEITNAQYAEFLNAVAEYDPHGLYYPSMAGSYGGITRSGVSPSYVYGTIAGREYNPVTYVSFYDTLRFVNWLENGQPTGFPDATTTEDGAYTFGSTTSVSARNDDATIVLPDEDEWFKASYFDPRAGVYYRYPTGTNELPTCAAPGVAANTAKCFDGDPNQGHPPVYATEVGGYPGSPSPNGSFDQGGNVWEWNETIISFGRGQRGGSFEYQAAALAASGQAHDDPVSESREVGFRVARLPEPGRGLLLMTALLTLACVRRASLAKRLPSRPFETAMRARPSRCYRGACSKS
jgi:sulfatase modifying factor 1